MSTLSDLFWSPNAAPSNNSAIGALQAMLGMPNYPSFDDINKNMGNSTPSASKDTATVMNALSPSKGNSNAVPPLAPYVPAPQVSQGSKYNISDSPEGNMAQMRELANQGVSTGQSTIAQSLANSALADPEQIRNLRDQAMMALGLGTQTLATPGTSNGLNAGELQGLAALSPNLGQGDSMYSNQGSTPLQKILMGGAQDAEYQNQMQKQRAQALFNMAPQSTQQMAQNMADYSNPLNLATVATPERADILNNMNLNTATTNQNLTTNAQNQAAKLGLNPTSVSSNIAGGASSMPGYSSPVNDANIVPQPNPEYATGNQQILANANDLTSGGTKSQQAVNTGYQTALNRIGSTIPNLGQTQIKANINSKNPPPQITAGDINNTNIWTKYSKLYGITDPNVNSLMNAAQIAANNDPKYAGPVLQDTLNQLGNGGIVNANDLNTRLQAAQKQFNVDSQAQIQAANQLRQYQAKGVNPATINPESLRNNAYVNNSLSQIGLPVGSNLNETRQKLIAHAIKDQGVTPDQAAQIADRTIQAASSLPQSGANSGQ